MKNLIFCGNVDHRGCCERPGFTLCFEFVRDACGRCGRVADAEDSSFWLVLWSEGHSNFSTLIRESDTADIGSSSLVSTSSSSSGMGARKSLSSMSKSSSDWLDAPSAGPLFDFWLALRADLDDVEPTPGYEHSLFPFRHPTLC